MFLERGLYSIYRRDGPPGQHDHRLLPQLGFQNAWQNLKEKQTSLSCICSLLGYGRKNAATGNVRIECLKRDGRVGEVGRKFVCAHDKLRPARPAQASPGCLQNGKLLTSTSVLPHLPHYSLNSIIYTLPIYLEVANGFSSLTISRLLS